MAKPGPDVQIKKVTELEKLNDILRNGSLAIGGILKEMNKAVKEYEKKL